MNKWLRSTYRALDAIIRNHFFDFAASVALPGSEEAVQSPEKVWKIRPTFWNFGEIVGSAKSGSEHGIDRHQLCAFYIVTTFLLRFNTCFTTQLRQHEATRCVSG